jgi:hypothetical protein
LEAGVAGKTMSTKTGAAPYQTTAPISFSATVHTEQNQYSLASQCFDPNADFWVWDYTYTDDPLYQRRAFTVNLPKVAATTATATVAIALVGGVDSPYPLDNQARAYVNGTLAGTANWEGTARCTLSATVPQSLLRAGANTIEVEALVPAGSDYGFFYIDAIDVTYRRAYAAVADLALVRGDGNTTVTVGGFSRSDVKVFDLADPRNPVVVGATRITSGAAGTSASFKPATAAREYLAVAMGAAAAPSASAAVVSANLKASANACDYVVIAPAALAATAAELAAYRQQQGLDAKVVTVESIFDEFNNRLRDPLAIKAFLAYTQTSWTRAPRYIVLAGKGSYDYANATGSGDCLVPPLMMSTPYGLVASDTLMADTNDDGLPNLAIGRLPVLTADQLRGVIAKIRAYEQGGAWKNRVTLVADNDDDAGTYTADSETVARSVSADYTDKAYLLQQSLSTVRASTLDAFRDGRAIVNYIGHGLSTQLAQEGILKSSDVPAMANAANAPVVLLMACNAGEFGYPGSDSLAETLVGKAEGGAVAVWAAANYAYAPESLILNAGFFETLSSANARIGDAIRGGLTKYFSQGHIAYVRYLYNLMGDPATIAGENM